MQTEIVKENLELLAKAGYDMIGVDNAEEILVVVDMQNDFTKGILGNDETKNVIPTVAKCIKEHRANGGKVIFTYDTHYADTYMDSQEGRNLPVPHCIKGTDGWELDKNVVLALEKRGYTPVEKVTFGSVDLPALIKEASKGEEFTVELIGLCTDICVVSNALMIKAHFPEVNVSVDEKCCAGVTVEKHIAALETMRSCQIDVIA